MVHLVILGELGTGGGLDLGELHVRRLHSGQLGVLVLDLRVETLGGGEVLVVVGLESLELGLHVGERGGFLARQLLALAAEALDLLAGGLAVFAELREVVVHLLADGLVLLARSEVRQAALGVEVVLAAHGGGGFGDLIDVLVQSHERLTVVVADRLANLAHLGRVVERGRPVVVRHLVRLQGVEGRRLLVAVAGRRADVHRQVVVRLRLRGVGAAGARVSGTLQGVADVLHGGGAHAERVNVRALLGHGHRALAVAKRPVGVAPRGFAELVRRHRRARHALELVVGLGERDGFLAGAVDGEVEVGLLVDVPFSGAAAFVAGGDGRRRGHVPDGGAHDEHRREERSSLHGDWESSLRTAVRPI